MTADHTPPSVDLSKEALDALVARLRATTIEQDTEGEKYAVPQCLAGPGAADAITALRSQIATERALADKAIAAEQARATAVESALTAAMEGAVRVKRGGNVVVVDGLAYDLRSLVDAAFSLVVKAGSENPGFDMLPWFYTGSPYAEQIKGLGVVGGPIPPDFVAERVPDLGKVWRSRRPLWECYTTGAAALEPNPAAQDREALVVATLERAAMIADHIDTMGDDGSGRWIRDEIRSLATQPQTDALAAVRREARAEGMRKAAGIVNEFDSGGQFYDPRLEASEMRTEIYSEILATAEKEAGHD